MCKRLHQLRKPLPSSDTVSCSAQWWGGMRDPRLLSARGGLGSEGQQGPEQQQ